ncbi:MAG TPA: glycosyltransferase [Ktedonobacterales bacterium]|nr:glycosyltransferase [Ktedonobacterales bacterium]
MSDVLFVTWDGGGNLPPALGIAAELTRRRHAVRFLGHEQQRATIEAAGFGFQPFTHARPWSSVAPYLSFQGAMKFLDVFTDRGMGEDLLREARRQPPDIIVIDCLLFGVLQAAERAGLRRAVLVHTLYSQQRATWGSGMGGMMTRLHGMRAPQLWLRSDLVLVTTLREIDHCGETPVTVHHTGPVWQDARPEPALPQPGDPLVVASLSTLFQTGQTKALQAIVDGLGCLPIRALVTTGPSIEPSALRPAANVEVRRFVSHAEVMPLASLVICHGGHSTAMAALSHDLPLVIMPMFALGDQPVIGRALERFGAARVTPKTASAKRIAEVVKELLADGPHRAAAHALGAKIRLHDGAVEAADALESLPIATSVAAGRL